MKINELEEEECCEQHHYEYSNKDYEISIKLLTKGCIVSVGCKSFAFQDYNEALREIDNWLTNPKQTIIKYKHYLK